MQAKERLVIIDGNMIVHRAYHALPPLTSKNGDLVNAVYGFLLVFLRVIDEFKPSYIAATFDTAKPTFRHVAFKDYKGKRPPTPTNLLSQIPKIKDILKEFGVRFFEKDGFEADDVMGTISLVARKKLEDILQNIPRNIQLIPLEIGGEDPAKEELFDIIILSGDLDTLQLINENTKVCSLKRGLKEIFFYNEKEVYERYGIGPAQIIDFKALKGDPSDNISGVVGIGEKTASLLIKEFISLDNLYYEIENNTKKAIALIRPTIRAKLTVGKKDAFFSKTLSTIKQDVPISFNLDDCSFKNYNKERASLALRQAGFASLLSKLP